MRSRRGFWLGLALLGAGCGGPADGRYSLATPAFELAVDGPASRVELREAAHGVELLGLHAALETDTDGRARLWRTLARPLACRRWDEPPRELLACQGEAGAGLAVLWTFWVRQDAPYVLWLETAFENRGAEATAVRRVFPLRVAAGDGGTVRLGAGAADVRVLQNGSDELADFYADLLPGDLPLTRPEDTILLSAYSSYSNGSLLGLDTRGGGSLLLGFLELPWAVPLVALAGEDGGAQLELLSAEARFPGPALLPAGASLDGGLAVLVLGAPSPFEALEEYAARVAEHHAIELPAAPLSGWDSWYTTVPARTELDQAYVEASAQGLAQRFGAYGLDSMQLDEGWQDQWGDWNARAGFPDGMPAAAAAIHAQGLTSEIWAAPFTASESSAIWRDHPDWFVEKNMYAHVVMPADMHAMDLGRPEVLAYAREVAGRLRDWGFGSVKLDFVYWALLTDLAPDPERAPYALYREAVRSFRAGLGPGVHFINISQVFPNYGLCDSFRIGLDTWPCWDGGSACGALGYPSMGGVSAQGVKPGVRMAARRYWLNGRVWWNHNDQLFFRDVSLEEARAFASLAHLAGGSISLGEDPGNLTDAQADVYRRILPLTGRTARPLDLFAREFPEVWSLPAAGAGEDDPGARVVGLFHWGANRDLTVLPYAERADGAALEQRVAFEALGLEPGSEALAYEFWSGATLGRMRGELRLTVPPHEVRVVRLLPVPDRPAYLGTNRHLGMGAPAVSGWQWDPGARRLTGRVACVPGFEHRLSFFVPAGFTFRAASLEGAPAPAAATEGEVVTLSFSGPGATPGTRELVLEF